MHKKLIVFFTVLSMLFVTGCSTQNMPGRIEAKDIVYSFECKADISYGKDKMTCLVSRSAAGIASIQLLTGDLNGLTYYWSGENFSISYQGLTAESEQCTLPKTSFAYILQQTIDSAEKDSVLVKTHGSEFSGTGEGYDFTLTVDENTGQIKSITIPKYEIMANLHDYGELGL